MISFRQIWSLVQAVGWSSLVSCSIALVSNCSVLCRQERDIILIYIKLGLNWLLTKSKGCGNWWYVYLWVSQRKRIKAGSNLYNLRRDTYRVGSSCSPTANKTAYSLSGLACAETIACSKVCPASLPVLLHHEAALSFFLVHPSLNTFVSRCLADPIVIIQLGNWCWGEWELGLDTIFPHLALQR